MINRSSLMNISGNRKILTREEDFAYLLPCEQLQILISNFTVSFPDKSTISDDYTVMPHGSVTLVLFSYETVLYSFLFGPLTKPARVGDIANKCDVIFIIEFQPAGFYPFVKINQKELTDKILPFSQVHSSLDNAMRKLLLSALSVDELLSEAEKYLILNIQFQYPGELEHAMNTIIQMEGVLTSAEIINNVFYSPRHLNRLFNQYLGMSMKSFSRLVRINKSIQLLNEKTNSLAFICEKLGYYDVSHFVKDFRIVCGVTPQEYRTNMSDFYSEIAKY
ncbi:helix-turn-helix domain-containing protein [Murimonas intestini]|uniref:Helix-turn-helix protein n=1 Tax=Murimonas intestini TaxID=1337051 RepID=A0AB73T5S9_9FIRM|nr:helix-turn-helix domain-containing protein [Murimonas intestini]MCR1842166.1 helix-turn-helix domain-containing protein [Murimonas intestini]MCR1864902.1 helix-turn-helix domain-containing protein [Murimonas intestini]MCR1884230.1 helix-turn-helix domain-containing protein [Murimonas intestini]